MNQQTQSLEVTRVGTEQDRRSRPRFYPDPEATRVLVELGTPHTQIALLVDECFDGIGVLLAERSDLQIGSEVKLSYRAAPMWAVVRYLYPTDDGTWRIGLRWKDGNVSALIPPA